MDDRGNFYELKKGESLQPGTVLRSSLFYEDDKPIKYRNIRELLAV